MAKLVPIPSWLHLDRETTDQGGRRIRLRYSWRRAVYVYSAVATGWLVILMAWQIAIGKTFLWLLLPPTALSELWLLVQLVNHSTLSIDADRIRLRHGPFPWFGRTVEARRVDGAYSDGRKLWLILDGEIQSELLSLSDGEKRLFVLARVIELALGLKRHPRQNDEKSVSGDFSDVASWVTPPPPGERKPGSPNLDNAPYGVRASRDAETVVFSLPPPVRTGWVLIGAVPGLIWLINYFKPESWPWQVTWSFRLPWILVDAAALVFVVIGLYLVAASLINRTRITLTPERLTVHNGPLPWPSPGELDADQVEQLYVKTRANNEATLELLRRDRVNLTVTWSYPDRLQWVVDRAHTALGIKRRKVSDELR